MKRLNLIFIILATFFTNVANAQVGVVTQPLYASSNGIWRTTNINVCWENPTKADAININLVRQAIRNSWETSSAVRFQGWGTCQPNSKGIRIKIANEWPHVKALGSQIDGLKDGMVLNFNWDGCRDGRCNELVAIHEFGHALGFSHEHNRPDCGCDRQPQGTNGDWLLTPCDINSVMNYCSPRYINDGELSGEDINGVRALYGTGNQYAEFTDASGKITIALFSKTTDVRRQHGRLEIPVSDEFIVIGGGGYAQKVGAGALLTASYPNEQLTSWIVASKDHIEAQPHFLQGYAIGIKVRGMTKAQLRSYITVVKQLSAQANHPTSTATVPTTHKIIGGGFNALWTSEGSLAVASYPIRNSWVAKSKDHVKADPSRIETYAIGINPNLPVGTLTVTTVTNTSSPASHPSTNAVMTSGYAMTCGGAYVNYTGEGNLIWQIQPEVNMTTRRQTLFVGSKDHIKPNTASISAYLIGVKF